MNTPTQSNILQLKKLLSFVIQENDYNLLSSDVLQISTQLDALLNPLFKEQLKQP